MAQYQFLHTPPDDLHPGRRACLVRPQTRLEAIKMAWYLFRYPKRTALWTLVDVAWCRKNLTPAQRGTTEMPYGGLDNE